MNSKRTFWIVIILLILVCIVIYLVSFGQVNIISEAEHADAVKRRLAEAKLKELEAEMEKDRALKKKLDRYVVWGFIGVKIMLLFALFGICELIKYFFHLSWSDLYEWQDKAGYCIALCAFILFGTELKFFRVYPWMRAMVKTWVYKKYGRLDLEKDMEVRAKNIEEVKGIIASVQEAAGQVNLLTDTILAQKKDTSI